MAPEKKFTHAIIREGSNDDWQYKQVDQINLGKEQSMDRAVFLSNCFPSGTEVKIILSPEEDDALEVDSENEGNGEVLVTIESFGYSSKEKKVICTADDGRVYSCKNATIHRIKKGIEDI